MKNTEKKSDKTRISMNRHPRMPLPGILVSVMAFMICMASVSASGQQDEKTDAVPREAVQEQQARTVLNKLPPSEARTISVSGEGEASAEPDTASFSVGYSALADTTKEAQKMVNQQIDRILEALLGFGIKEKQIRTERLQISPEYEWTDGGRKLIGQRVRQTLGVKIDDIVLNTERLPAVMDFLGGVQGVEISSINFYVDNTEELYRTARERAFHKAEQKAGELASLSRMKLSYPISITENSRDVNNQPVMDTMLRAEAASMKAPETSVPAGEITVSVRVSAVFEMMPYSE
ncbi:MAG: SIMPL domain-containing protein [Spirochaetia bacterium]|nr:SIMPL domain-containing protein [Spirochaetia bacterium]